MENFIKQHENPHLNFELLNLPLTDHAVDVLEHYGIETYEDIAKYCTRRSLLKVNSIGPKTVTMVELALESKGLKLGEELPLENERRLFVIQNMIPETSLSRVVIEAFNYLDYRDLDLLKEVSFGELKEQVKDYLMDKYDLQPTEMGILWLDMIMEESLKITNKLQIQLKASSK